MSREELEKVIALLKQKFPDEWAQLGVGEIPVVQDLNERVEEGQYLDVVGHVGSFVVLAVKQVKKVVRFVAVAASVWSAVDFCTPGRLPDLFDTVKLVQEGTPSEKEIATVPSSSKVIVFNDDWAGISSAEDLPQGPLDMNDSEKLEKTHFVPTASGIGPEVFENGRVFKVSAESTLLLSDKHDLS